MKRDIIVIGTSAGGVPALKMIVAGLPENLKASLFIVLHIPPLRPSLLPVILSSAGSLPALHPGEGMIIEQGKIYVAPPDHHLVIAQGCLHLGTGPKEYFVRPSANVLFRSAAQEYGPRVVGIVLTGSGYDGAEGLLAIKQHGGIAVIQDPADALYPSMPENALAHAPIDYAIPLSAMASFLMNLLSSSSEQAPE